MYMEQLSSISLYFQFGHSSALFNVCAPSMSFLFSFVTSTPVPTSKLFIAYYLPTNLLKTVNPDFCSCIFVLLGNRTAMSKQLIQPKI